MLGWRAAHWPEPNLCPECGRLKRALLELVEEDPGHRFDLASPEFVASLYARARRIAAREN